MKKKNIIILVASLSMVASLGTACGVLTASLRSPVAVKADGEKTVAYVNVTTQNGLNEINLLLNLDTEIAGTGGNYQESQSLYWRAANVTHNNVSYEAGLTLFANNPKVLYVSWGSTYPSDTSYHHWQLKKGTVLFETSDTSYVLEDDYNWWQTRLSGGGAGVSWMFQHGGNSAFWNAEIPSFSLADGATGVVNNYTNSDGSKVARYNITADYTKSSAWKSNGVWNSNAFFYSFDDSGDYTLAYNGDSDGHELNLTSAGTGGISETTDLTGKELLLFNFSGLGTETGTDKFVSFYLPSGTLFGGLNQEYGCFLENDYYITIMNDKIVGGTTTSSQDLIYAPVKNFITSYMHMSDTAYDGAGTGSCKGDVYNAAKNAYNALSDNQKFTFCNYDGYADEKARLLAWAAANGDALDASNAIVEKKSSSLLIGASSRGSDVYVAAICAGALALVGAGACFVFRKKRED